MAEDAGNGQVSLMCGQHVANLLLIDHFVLHSLPMDLGCLL